MVYFVLDGTFFS